MSQDKQTSTGKKPSQAVENVRENPIPPVVVHLDPWRNFCRNVLANIDQARTVEDEVDDLFQGLLFGKPNGPSNT